MEAHYQQAGPSGAYDSGREAGKLLAEIGGYVVGVGAVAKGSTRLASKQIDKLRASRIATVNQSLGLGSTGRNIPLNLKEQLALKQAISNPTAGRQLSIPMADKRWLTSEGWVKMSQNINGIEIHYVRNIKTGAIDDFKFK
ncbi:hypothetical protein PGS62_04030 [Yersinia rochesterensis]|nr:MULTISPECIES: hypothetical protein [Yersinia]MDA5543117.1 hypothetical protein [Yersinia rochesterensis]UZM75788.1 hypothetical protein OP863_03700 [Yersinia sp. SCPM-O-B-9106 (C-191)]